MRPELKRALEETYPEGLPAYPRAGDAPDVSGVAPDRADGTLATLLAGLFVGFLLGLTVMAALRN